ncbi:hypothetical protein BU17DRAFT_82590 [Hysterangium stoloniferum]|nr:hypothetical protein BU17DRAFT_82590 [Hysterangium stoloniferum]
MQVDGSAKTFTSNNQIVDIFWGGVSIGDCSGSGENATMVCHAVDVADEPLEQGGDGPGDDHFVIGARDEAYDIVFTFQFSDGNGVKNAVVKNAPSQKVVDGVTRIEIGSQDSTDDGGNDVVFQLVYSSELLFPLARSAAAFASIVSPE